MTETTTRRGPKPNPHTRDNLIAAGMKLFHEKGYADTGIKDIVEEAGVPKGSFYNYFESKEIFAKAVVDSHFQNALRDLTAHFENPSLPPLQRLKTYFEQKRANFQAVGYVQGCLMGNFSLEIADHSVVIRDSLHANFQTWSRLFENCIAEAQQRGDMTNTTSATQLAPFILNSWEGALLRMRVEKNDVPLQAFMDIMFGIVLV